MEEVWIDFKSQMKMHDEIETHEFTARGQLQSDGESLILNFSEPNHEAETRAIQTRIIATPAKVVMTRTGSIQMQQTFDLNNDASGTYVTTYGRLKTRAQTYELGYTWDEIANRGHFCVRYDFYIETELSGEFNLNLQIRSMK